MIMTPRVPTLVEDSTNVGTEEKVEIPEETPQEFAANSSISDKVGFMKQSAVTLIYVTEAIEKEFQEHAELKKLVNNKLEKVKSLESQLNKEKVTSTQLYQIWIWPIKSYEG